jgi:hypothetical protein
VVSLKDSSWTKSVACRLIMIESCGFVFQVNSKKLSDNRWPQEVLAINQPKCHSNSNDPTDNHHPSLT